MAPRLAEGVGSLPLRERGLKYYPMRQVRIYLLVAPFTGAWIEILSHGCRCQSLWVAPFTGAWIEIQALISSARTRPVAPFTGAWIEITDSSPYTIAYARSLPLRERGLKYGRRLDTRRRYGSLPLRERGLKYDIITTVVRMWPSLPLRERGLKSTHKLVQTLTSKSLPLRERGLKLWLPTWSFMLIVSLPLRERGLKFRPRIPVGSNPQVAPFTGAWIEIFRRRSSTRHL